MTKQEALKIAKPILFNSEMVRAILDGRKTVTRRLIKPQPESVVKTLAEETVTPLVSLARFLCTNGEREWIEGIKMSYQKGDVFYVRETWGRYSVCEGIMPDIYYKADGNAPDKIKWIPSIHMPREAARIFLRVTDVRVERLQAMSIDDIRQEGITENKRALFKGTYGALLEEFMELWDTTVKKSDRDKYGWAANPWVYVIEFERVKVK